ncbi:uncharacterized protein LOC141712722 [Apium graveolens]|uniref:uncharacterized protein LOC141712722 n=1 Tax=Apium graveolens TaxID=4045 RepID=UPI003D79B14A
MASSNVVAGEDLLDVMCDCYRMSVVKTRWFGVNAGRRFRECGDDNCGYHKWIDPPLSARAVEVIEELQQRNVDAIDKLRWRMDRMVTRHQAQLDKLKRKEEFTVIAMFVLFSLMMNMVLQSLGQVSVDEKGYDSIDE